MNSDRASKVFNSRNILLTQLGGIGYDTTAYVGASIEEVNAMDINVQLDMMMSHNENRSKIYVNYHIGDDNFSERTLTTLMNNLFRDVSGGEDGPILNNTDIIMVILNDDVSESLTNTMMRVFDKNGHLIIPRTIDQLQFNILNHVLVPKHTTLADEDLATVLRKYNATASQLPKISRFDPVAKAICMRPGQVCEILRPSNNAIQAKYYRVCVNSEFKM
jgi:DNA-directed RNA polymerase subunit H (RpoH/RPB5)